MEQGHVGRRCGTDPAGLAALLLEAFEAAKFEGGTAAGFAGGQAGSDVVRDLLLEVELRLGVEAPFGQAFAKDGGTSAWAASLLRSSQDQSDGIREALPIRNFRLQLFAALARERVKLRFPAGGGVFPLGLEPVLLLKTVQGGIEGTLRDLKEIPGNLLDALGDGVAVKGSGSDDLEDQHVESSLEELHFFLSHRLHLVVLPI